MNKTNENWKVEGNNTFNIHYGCLIPTYILIIIQRPTIIIVNACNGKILEEENNERGLEIKGNV